MPVFRDPTHVLKPFRRWCRDEGHSPGKGYGWIAAGEFESVVIGGRRYVVLASYYDFVDRQIAAGRVREQHPVVARTAHRRATPRNSPPPNAAE
jgi:hypothetical protein